MTRQKNAIFLLGVLLDASPFQVFSLFLKNGLNMFENKKRAFFSTDSLDNHRQYRATLFFQAKTQLEVHIAQPGRTGGWRR